jgi:hypothetical protein
MHERDWLKDENYGYDRDGRVWIAVEPTGGGGEVVSVVIGYKCPGFAVWRFDNGQRVADSGMHVLGWYPCYPPTYVRN